jgi:DNA invertase Pin-like site-specific DNA recombinase
MEKRIFGYARVSSKEQNLDRQIISLQKYVEAERIVVDKASGKDLGREGYQALKGALGLRAGDTLYITSLDRLSRNKSDIKKELEWFKNSNIRLMILDLPTSMIEVPEGQEWIIDMVQNILIEVIASIAEQERITIRKRQREGIEAAKKKGKHMGRPVVKMPEQFGTVYEEWKRGMITAQKAMKVLGLSRSTFYRMVRVYDEQGRVKKSEDFDI